MLLVDLDCVTRSSLVSYTAPEQLLIGTEGESGFSSGHCHQERAMSGSREPARTSSVPCGPEQR